MAKLFTVSRDEEWGSYSFAMVPNTLIMCNELKPNEKLVLMFFISQLNYKAVDFATLDLALSLHRTTRMRCIEGLRKAGFVKGSESHLVLNDPTPILDKMWKERVSAQAGLGEVVSRYCPAIKKEPTSATAAEQRDYMQEAADSWNRYRPKDYSKIRRISSELVKAVDMHMRHLKVKAHDYDQFFSVLKAGVEKNDFWSKQNRSKNLQSITGIGASSDTKRGNVYALFETGVEAPAAEVSEDCDTVVYPVAYRNLIEEYSYAQTTYLHAYRNRQPLDDPAKYVTRTEGDLRQAGLDPLKFKFKYGIPNWPTDTPEPETERIEDWIYEDEVSR